MYSMLFAPHHYNIANFYICRKRIEFQNPVFAIDVCNRSIGEWLTIDCMMKMYVCPNVQHGIPLFTSTRYLAQYRHNYPNPYVSRRI